MVPPPPCPSVEPDQEALRQKLEAARNMLAKVQVPKELKLKIRWAGLGAAHLAGTVRPAVHKLRWFLGRGRNGCTGGCPSLLG